MFRRGSAVSSVNHQFRLARFAETFASASRTFSGWVRVSSRSPTPNRSGERRSSGKPPLSDHDQWPLCANSGHTPTSRRMGQIDPLLPFPIDPGTGEEHQKATVAATSRTRQDRPLGMQRPNASVRTPKVPVCYIQTDYIRHVRNFATFLGCSPDAATTGSSPIPITDGQGRGRRADQQRRRRRIWFGI